MSRRVCMVLTALVLVGLQSGSALAQASLERDFMRRFAFYLGAEFGHLTLLKVFSRKPRDDVMRDIQLRLTENVRAVGWTVRIGRTDGADRRAILGELRTASENLADHLDARFGGVISSAFQAGKELYAVAGATLFKGDEKQGYLTRSRQYLIKAQIDPKLAAPLHEFVSASDNYDAAFGIVETVRATVLRDMDQRLLDTPTFRRLRSNAFQAATNLATAALSGRADMQRSNQLFERARIFADNIRVEVPGFTPPALELARIPADGTDSSTRLAKLWLYLLDEQTWISQVGEIYGFPTSDIATAAVRLRLSTLVYGGNDDLGTSTRNAVCTYMRLSAVPVDIWSGAVDNRVAADVNQRLVGATLDAVKAFLESTRKSDVLPVVRGEVSARYCPTF
jgi:hypothetical protein